MTYQHTEYPVNQYETYEPEAENWETKNYQETVYPDMTDYQPTYPTKTYDYASKAYQTEYPEAMTYQHTEYPVNQYETYEPEAENWETKNYQETVYPDKTYDYAHKASSKSYPTEYPEPMTYQHTEYPEPMTYQQTAHPVNTYQETGYPTESYYNTPYYNTIPPQVGQEIDQSSEMYTQTVYPSETYSTYPTETYTVYPAETYTATMTMQPEFQVPDYHTYTATAPTNALGQYEQYTAAPLSTYPTATEYSQAPEAYTTSTDSSQLP